MANFNENEEFFHNKNTKSSNSNILNETAHFECRDEAELGADSNK